MRMRIVALLLVGSLAVVGGCSDDEIAAFVAQLSEADVEGCVEDGVFELFGLMAKMDTILNAIAQGEPPTELGLTGSGQNWSFDCDFASSGGTANDTNMTGDIMFSDPVQPGNLIGQSITILIDR